MMNKSFLILLSSLLLILSCTRDDICSEQTPKTPLLIIRFVDAEAPQNFKEVTDFQLFFENGITFSTNPITTDSIAIPLDTSVDFTQYRLVSNANDSLNLKENLVVFSYLRIDEYINRACAFRTNFEELESTTETTENPDWIISTEIINPSVNARNQNEAHLYIFH